MGNSFAILLSDLMMSYLDAFTKKILDFYSQPNDDDDEDDEVNFETLQEQADDLFPEDNGDEWQEGDPSWPSVSGLDDCPDGPIAVEVATSGFVLDGEMRAAFQMDGSLIDTHCHLDFLSGKIANQFENFEALKSHYRDEFPQSFDGCIAVFCKPETWMVYGLEQRLLDETSVWTTFGCHPHFADTFTTFKLLELQTLLKRKNVVALGEIGLDYSFKNTVDRLTQQKIFDCQLKLAMKTNLPVVLHVRDAMQDALTILENAGLAGTNYPLHLHCFTTNWDECQIWLDKFPGLMVGFTPFICNETRAHIHEVVKQIPLNRLLLETDAPYFYPRQLQVSTESDYEQDIYKPSHPGLVIFTAMQVAQLRNVSIKDVLDQTRENVRTLYKI